MILFNTLVYGTPQLPKGNFPIYLYELVYILYAIVISLYTVLTSFYTVETSLYTRLTSLYSGGVDKKQGGVDSNAWGSRFSSLRRRKELRSRLLQVFIRSISKKYIPHGRQRQSNFVSVIGPSSLCVQQSQTLQNYLTDFKFTVIGWSKYA